MGKKNRKGGVVYSTDPDFEYTNSLFEELKTPTPYSKQKLIVKIDRKQRNGKEVTLIEGFEGNKEELSELGKHLKKICGVGGSAKEGIILIQGNHRDKVVEQLINMGYSHTKKSGG